ncbi:MAG: dihydrofolate reductase [Bacteroidota bacterium]
MNLPTSSRSVGLLLASSLEGAIGDGNDLLWKLPEDLSRFKALTMGHSCIMGRKTLLSIGRALPGRQMVVMSRQANLSENSRAAVEEPAYFRQCFWAGSPREALALCSEADPVWVIGGAEIYRVMEEHADFIERTEVEGLWPEAQARFPLDPNRWTLVNFGEWLTSSSGLRFRYQRLERTAI